MIKSIVSRIATALWWMQMRAAVRRQNWAIRLDSLMRRLKMVKRDR